MKTRITTLILFILVIVLAVGWFNAERKKVETVPAASQEFPPVYSLPTPENFWYFGTTVFYNGEATVTGEYMPGGFRDEVCFKVNEASRKKLPKQQEQFCFKNQPEAAKMLYGVDINTLISNNFEGYPNGNVTIRIDKYELHTSEVGSRDATTLVEVVK